MSITSIASTAGRTVFDLAYRCSPILLTGGLASSTTGGVLPIISFTESIGFANNLLNGNITTSTDDFFAHFSVVPGGSLINNQVGQYPFANQTVAGNALIAQPLNLSVMMDCPPRGAGAYVTKLSTIMALQAALYQHNQMGGLYTVITPGFLYTSMIMTNVVDASPDPIQKPQSRFIFNFERPLTQESEVQQAQSTLMSKLSGGQQTGTSWATTGTGNPFSSLIGSLA